MIRDAAIGFVTGLVVAGAVCAYSTLNKIPLPSVLAPPAKELAKEQTTKLTGKPVIVYRDKVAEKLGITAKTGQHVTASTKLPGDDRPRTVSALYDEASGGTSLFVRRDPLPWLGFSQQRSVGIAFGWQDGGSVPVVRLDGRWQLLQIKALRGGLVGAVDTGGRWFAGVGAEVRF